MPGNPLVRFDEGRVGRAERCRPLSYSTVLAPSREAKEDFLDPKRNRQGEGAALACT